MWRIDVLRGNDWVRLENTFCVFQQALNFCDEHKRETGEKAKAVFVSGG